ncbi:YtxH domain-containing protein [Chitinophagaceae bacterium LB-8]|uniref:YtxH domain-containing protein n=1 Tax=Paraflavisolibacter caeni TaxID=2982496 RepID=A0A9X3BHC1_9BACT|nr:YtxH domain-containing protein [Paraflavisolibacter caeni]MCU7552159.1 YtxH domain-containing protein [Paraflavisolibacter caeni]
MKDVNKVLIAAAIGLVAGSVLGILMAPEKGSGLRKKLVSRAKEISADIFEDAKERLTCLQEEKSKQPVSVN